MAIWTQARWETVQWQFKFASRTGIQRLGGQARTEQSRTYIFSGIPVYGGCRSKLVICSGDGKRGDAKYGCPSHRYGGIFANALCSRRDRLEEQLIGALETRLLEKHTLDYLFKRVHEVVLGRIGGIEKASGQISPEALRGKVQELAQQDDRLARSSRGHWRLSD